MQNLYSAFLCHREFQLDFAFNNIIGTAYMNRTLFLLICLLASLTGCASVQLGDKSVEADLKQFKPIPGKTSLYICRENAVFVGAGINTTIFLNGEDIGTVKPNSFVHAPVIPGKQAIQMKNDGIASVYNPSMTVETKPDELSFLWIGVTGNGWGTYTIDNFVNQQLGMDCVSKASYSVKVR